MTEIHGFCDDRYTAVRDAFAKNFEDGLDVGASACVVVDDEIVVDIWGGTTGPDTDQQWTEDTITNVWSTTKTMTALSALLLADRGELDFNAPVANYWPEFKANGKEGVEVRHLMAHTSGLSGWEEPITPEDLWDWEKATSLLAAQAPWWEPGTASGYHAITQGFLVGEVVRRISGKSLGTFFHDELAGPLGADFQIGTKDADFGRISNVIPPPPLDAQLPPEALQGPAGKTFMNPPMDATYAWADGWRRAEIPAANGHGNARSVATVQSVLSHRGERQGKRFLSPAGCEKVFEEQIRNVDLVLGADLSLGIGYGLSSDATPLSPNKQACFWGGWGGSIVVNDLDANMTVAYVMNRMGEGTLGDLRGAGIVFAAHGARAAAG